MTDEQSMSRRVGGSPAADGGPARAEALRRLQLAAVADETFDEVARRIADSTGSLAAMVNLVGEERMFFAGVAMRSDLAPGDPLLLADPGREMALDHGFCPHVVARRKALVLDDVCAYPRFAGNPVVDELGVRSYLGAPLIDDDGTVIGTVCAVDPTPRTGPEDDGWGTRSLETIKKAAEEVVAEIRARRQVPALLEAAPGAALVTSGPRLEVLNINTAHERLFGTVREFGVPALEAFPDLAYVGVPDAVARVARDTVPVVTDPVRLADGRGLLFAIVPARVPGHSSAQLTLGMFDTEAAHAVAVARELSDNLSKLCE
jgi:GAF domain-containing protein